MTLKSGTIPNLLPKTNEMVKAWKESVTIPTYKTGKAEKKPIFLEKRAYQGSSGAVYPYPQEGGEGKEIPGRS